MKQITLIILFTILSVSINKAHLLESINIVYSDSNQHNVVYICTSLNAYAYHAYKCSGLNRCKRSIWKVDIVNAKNKGYKPCKICY